MKKLWGFLICFVAVTVWAQTTPTELFDLTDESIFGESTEQTYTGKPVVLINKKQTPAPQINKAEQLPPPDLKKNALKIPIKTFFGHDRTAAFVDHTTDFMTIVQVLDTQNIQVTEQIQFITTKDGETFKRFFPNKIVGPDGKEVAFDIEFLSLKQDQSFIPFDQKTTPAGIEIIFDKPLTKGVHKMTMEYLVSRSIKVNQSLAEITLPITGPGWGQMTERMAVLVMMPKKSKFYEKEFLFGSNNQKIPENTKISEDGKGVLTFQNTHPLPAYADVRLHLVLDAQDLPKAPKEKSIIQNIIKIFVLVLIGYIGLSILTARLKKWKKPLAESKKINPVLWATEIGESQNDYQIRLMENRQIRFMRFSAWAKKILAFLRFNGEYMFGAVLLILTSKYMALHYKIEINTGIYILFLLLSVGGILIIDYYGTRIQLIHLKEAFKKSLLDKQQGLNLAKREIPTYYQIAVFLGFHETWKKELIANNPTYKDLTCFEKEK